MPPTAKMPIISSFSMTPTELLSIQQKYKLESQAYTAIMKVIMAIGVLLGTIVWLIEVWHNAHAPKLIEQTHVAKYAFGILIIFVIFIGFAVYFATVRPLYLDSIHQTKLIATLPIVYKEAFPDYQLYKVTTTHAYTPTINVSAGDFNTLKIGDEINIEYAAHSKEFFNYF
jgi:amino acid permease